MQSGKGISKSPPAAGLPGSRGGTQGAGQLQPAPPPLAEAPGGAGRGGQMLRRRREPRRARRARSLGGRLRLRAPLALSAQLQPRIGELAGRTSVGSATDMHSARLDSFLSQLRWELLCGRDTGSPPMPGPLKSSTKPDPGLQPNCQLRASDVLEDDSVCCVEEEEEGLAAEDRSAALGSPREHALDWDSGFSEVSGSTWREEELSVPRRPAPPLRPPQNQRFSVSGLPLPSRAPMTSVPPVHRPRPKSTPDACLEHWQGLEAEDWTAALLNRGRSRQPLVLGDNCFADLVHNWMELPEAPSEGSDEGAPRSRPRPPQFLLGLSEQLRRRLARTRRAAMAGKRLSCPPCPEHDLPADISHFAALMNCRSRQPLIYNDVSYL